MPECLPAPGRSDLLQCNSPVMTTEAQSLSDHHRQMTCCWSYQQPQCGSRLTVSTSIGGVSNRSTGSGGQAPCAPPFNLGENHRLTGMVPVLIRCGQHVVRGHALVEPHAARSGIPIDSLRLGRPSLVRTAREQSCLLHGLWGRHERRQSCGSPRASLSLLLRV